MEKIAARREEIISKRRRAAVEVSGNMCLGDPSLPRRSLEKKASLQSSGYMIPSASCLTAIQRS